MRARALSLISLGVALGFLAGVVVTGLANVEYDGEVSLIDAAQLLLNIIAVALIPYLITRASDRRSTWVPSVLQKAEAVEDRCDEIADWFRRAADAPQTADDCREVLAKVSEARRLLRSVRSRLAAFRGEETAQRHVDPALRAFVGVRRSFGDRFPSDDFRPTPAELAEVSASVRSARELVMTVVKSCS